MKKKIVFGSIILAVAIAINFNLSSKNSRTLSSDLTLKNIHLLQAYAQSEMGQSCYGGSEYTGNPSDYCVTCGNCTGQFMVKCIGWHGDC